MRKKYRPKPLERELQRFVNARDESVLKRMHRRADGGDGGLSARDYYAAIFRQCWAANDPLRRGTANLSLDQILTENPRNPQRLEALRVLRQRPFPADEQPRPAFCVDLTGAGFRLNARDYLDLLAFVLIMARRRLGICLAENCKHRYFVSRYPRQHYCSDRCLAKGRRASKRKWAKFNYRAADPKEFGTRTKRQAIFIEQDAERVDMPQSRHFLGTVGKSIVSRRAPNR